MDQLTDDMVIAVKDQIELADKLASKLDTVQNIDGVLKLQRKIKQEKEFFKSVSSWFNVMIPCKEGE